MSHLAPRQASTLQQQRFCDMDSCISSSRRRPRCTLSSAAAESARQAPWSEFNLLRSQLRTCSHEVVAQPGQGCSPICIRAAARVARNAPAHARRVRAQALPPHGQSCAATHGYRAPLRNGTDDQASNAEINADKSPQLDGDMPLAAAAAERHGSRQAHQRDSAATCRAHNAPAPTPVASATLEVEPAQSVTALEQDASGVVAAQPDSCRDPPRRKEQSKKLERRQRAPAKAAVAAGERVSMLNAVFRVERTESAVNTDEPWRWSQQPLRKYCSGVAVRLPDSSECWLLTTAQATYGALQVFFRYMLRDAAAGDVYIVNNLTPLSWCSGHVHHICKLLDV